MADIVVEKAGGNVLRLRCTECSEYASLMAGAATRAHLEEWFREQHAACKPQEASPSTDGKGPE